MQHTIYIFTFSVGFKEHNINCKKGGFPQQRRSQLMTIWALISIGRPAYWLLLASYWTATGYHAEENEGKW